MERQITALKRAKFQKLDRIYENLDEARRAANISAACFRTVRLPHDWAIEGDFDINNDIVYREDGSVKYTGVTGGLPSVGTGIYRIPLEIPATYRSGYVAVEFDGVMDECEVFLNGRKAGSNHWGYRSFCVDLTPYVTFGGENLLEVSVRVRGETSRWYTGAGIFRPARLILADASHFTYTGTRITSRLEQDGATVKICTSYTGDPASLRAKIVDAEGKTVTERFFRGTETELFFPKPHCWDPDDPYLYTLELKLSDVGGEATDCTSVPFGLRTAEFFPDRGFFLNGSYRKMKGVCLHHDQGLLGAAYNESAVRREMSKLREMGCNAVRTTHNPPAPQFLDLCDRMGFLVVEEFFDEWRIPKCKNGYNTRFDRYALQDIRDVIARDANHPCILMWSIGNEIPEQITEDGWKTAKMLSDACHQADPTRPTTVGTNRSDESVPNGFSSQVDVLGLNYRCRSYMKLHKDHPEFILYGSETESSWSSRGEYKLPVVYEHERVIREDLTVNAYETSMNRTYTPEKEFSRQEYLDFVCGQFTWTGFDYLGEPAPYDVQWPARSSYFGIFDLAGLPKDRFWLFQSEWTDTPVLHLFPHWNWEGMEGQEIPVHCFSGYPKGELFVNGKSMGVRKRYYGLEHELEQYRFIWEKVPFEPGEIRVVAYDKDGNPVAEDVRRTAGTPQKLVLTPEKALSADPEDVTFVRVSVVDGKGVECPKANNLVHFSAKGAEIVGSDNGDQRDVHGLWRPERALYNGLCVVALRTDGSSSAELLATAEGLESAEIIWEKLQ